MNVGLTFSGPSPGTLHHWDGAVPACFVVNMNKFDSSWRFIIQIHESRENYFHNIATKER